LSGSPQGAKRIRDSEIDEISKESGIEQGESDFFKGMKLKKFKIASKGGSAGEFRHFVFFSFERELLLKSSDLIRKRVHFIHKVIGEVRAIIFKANFPKNISGFVIFCFANQVSWRFIYSLHC